MSLQQRRRFLTASISCAMVAGQLPSVLYAESAPSFARQSLADSELTILSDGNLQQPVNRVLPESLIDKTERDVFLTENNLTAQIFEPDCNIALWRSDERLVIFDTGAGSNFMPTTGKLLESLAAADIDPTDVTDVVYTHAHPDHLWGLVDDFDELAFPQAAYHMNAREWDYWRADSTMDETPDNRKSFVAGARNRFPFIEEQINLFNTGDELLPGVEAVDTQGHTPGHTSFALHRGGDSVLIVGDALTNAVVSFKKPNWLSGSDQDPELARTTRVKLLDRLAHEKTPVVGFHLPHPGYGFVERQDSHYRFSAQS